MTTTTTIETDTGGKVQMVMKIEATKTHTRLSMDGSIIGNKMPGGMYSIYDIAAKTVTMIMPGMKMATVTDMSDTTRNAQVAPNIEQIGDPLLVVEDRGAGEPVLGLTTHRYHVKSEKTSTYTFGAVSCQKTEVEEGDVWTTPEFEPPAEFSHALSSFGGIVSKLYTKADALRRGKMKGFVVKQLGTTFNRTSAGVSELMRGNTELTAFSKAAIDDARFAVPPDYRVMDFSKMAAGIDPSIMAQAMSTAGETAIKKACGEGAKKSR